MALIRFIHDDMTLPESGADYDAALSRYYALAKETGLRDGFVAKQVHGVALLCADEAAYARPLLPTILGEGDAVWTSRTDSWVGVFTADCQSILIDAGERVMALHAGWRGIAADIIGVAVAFLGTRHIRTAVLGPSAKSCCYRVGPEVFSAIAAAGIEPVRRSEMLDIPETCAKQLRALGVEDVRFSDPFGCTICDSRFRSHRRMKERAGRALALIARTGS